MITVVNAMTPDPTTIRPNESVLRAAQLMDELNVGALPVCRGTHLLGIVTNRDITVRAIAAGLHATSTPMELVMSDRVRSCTPKQSVAEVLHRMSSVQIRRLMVVDEDDRPVGIISLGDIAAQQGEGVEDALRCISTPAQPDRAAAVAP